MTKPTSLPQGTIISGSLLISGTCIGGGMLAIPMMTSQAGLWPALLITTLSWIYMLCTGLLYLQATLWMPKDSNLFSMSQRFLGKSARNIGATFFLLLYYCLLIAYISGISPLFNQLAHAVSLPISSDIMPILIVILFGSIIFLGAKTIDRINTLFMIGLIITYVMLFTQLASSNSESILLRNNWTYSILSAPILFSAFGFHNIIPTVTTYLKKDIRKLNISVIIGTAIPFIIYILWQWVLIETIPTEVLKNALSQGLPVTEVIKPYFKSGFFVQITNFFSIFALVTSLLGVAFSMVDFLSDGLSLGKQGLQRLILCILTFLPPLIFSLGYPGMFVKALSFAGGFGESVLNGFFPILMVWRGNHHFKLSTFTPFLKNRAVLVILLLFTIVIIFAEIYEITFLHST